MTFGPRASTSPSSAIRTSTFGNGGPTVPRRIRPGGSHRKDRRGFRQSVAFQDRQADAQKEAREVAIERRAAGHGLAKPAADACRESLRIPSRLRFATPEPGSRESAALRRSARLAARPPTAPSRRPCAGDRTSARPSRVSARAASRRPAARRTSRSAEPSGDPARSCRSIRRRSSRRRSRDRRRRPCARTRGRAAETKGPCPLRSNRARRARQPRWRPGCHA